MNIARNNANEFQSSRQPIAGFIRKHLNDKFLRESANVRLSKLDVHWIRQERWLFVNSIDLGKLWPFGERIR